MTRIDRRSFTLRQPPLSSKILHSHVVSLLCHLNESPSIIPTLFLISLEETIQKLCEMWFGAKLPYELWIFPQFLSDNFQMIFIQFFSHVSEHYRWFRMHAEIIHQMHDSLLASSISITVWMMICHCCKMYEESFRSYNVIITQRGVNKCISHDELQSSTIFSNPLKSH